MMNPTRLALLDARKAYSRCANKLESTIKKSGLSGPLSEQVIGVGVAADWLRRAVEMEDIAYLGSQLGNSKRNASFVEVLRFGFSWIGMNAVFARPSLLSLIGVAMDVSEFSHFLVLFDATPLPDAPAWKAELHGLLTAQVSSRLPGMPPGATLSTLNAIQTKYLSHGTPKGRTAKLIAAAAASGNVAPLDLAMLLYAFRNWSIHGSALDGCFGSRPGFLRYVGILQQSLAEVHVCTAEQILSKI
jgi:hypothetical protein